MPLSKATSLITAYEDDRRVTQNRFRESGALLMDGRTVTKESPNISCVKDESKISAKVWPIILEIEYEMDVRRLMKVIRLQRESLVNV